MQSFALELKFRTGAWFLFPSGLCFHEPYSPYGSIEQVLTRTARLKDIGLTALEAHDPTRLMSIPSREAQLIRARTHNTGIRSPLPEFEA
jgi:xylose isomerase